MKTCSECGAFITSRFFEEKGECRRHAPMCVRDVGREDEPPYLIEWPWVGIKDWCCEWIPKEEDKP